MSGPLSRRRLVRWTVGVVIVAMVGLGALLWVTATDQTKQAELGAGLVSTGLFGVLLLALEQVLSRQTQEVDRKVSLAAGPEPARYTMLSGSDVRAVPSEPARRGAAGRDTTKHDSLPEAPGATTAEPARASREPADGVPTPAEPRLPTSPRHFTVEVDTWMRDTSRVDADVLRLVAWADGEYFQFFTAVVPGTAFRVTLHGARNDGLTLARFRRGIGDLAVRQIRRTISLREAPRGDDPTIAIELFPDVDEAARIGRGMPDSEHTPGEVIGEWTEIPGLSEASPFVRGMVDLAATSPIAAVTASYQAVGAALASLVDTNGVPRPNDLNIAELGHLAREQNLIGDRTLESIDGINVMHTMALLDQGGTELTEKKALEYVALVEEVLLAIRSTSG